MVKLVLLGCWLKARLESPIFALTDGIYLCCMLCILEKFLEILTEVFEGRVNPFEILLDRGEKICHVKLLNLWGVWNLGISVGKGWWFMLVTETRSGGMVFRLGRARFVSWWSGWRDIWWCLMVGAELARVRRCAMARWIALVPWFRPPPLILHLPIHLNNNISTTQNLHMFGWSLHLRKRMHSVFTQESYKLSKLVPIFNLKSKIYTKMKTN